MSASASSDLKISLLYVDDEPALLEVTRLFLEKTGGFSVFICNNAYDALKILRLESFDVIISDYEMPGCDGISFLKHLRKTGNETPFIIFTGKGREEVVIEALNEGADFYLQKGGDPISQFAELSNKIRYAVRKKQGEEALRESEERYRSVVETQTEFICRFLPDGTHVFVNEAYCRRFNKRAEELIGSCFKPAIHPDDVQKVTRLFASLTPKKPVGAVEQRSILSDGRIVWDRWTTQALFHDDGTLREYQSVGQDITDRKKALEALRASEAQKEAILNGIGINIAYVNSDLEIVWANRTAARSVNMEQDDITGRRCYELWANSSGPCPNCPTVKAFQTIQSEHTIIHTPDGRYWDERGEPVFDAEGRLTGVVEIAQDITDRKKALEALRASEAQFRSYVDGAPLGIFLADEKGEYLFVNDAACQTTGYTREELIKKKFIELIFPDDIPKAVDHFHNVVETGSESGKLRFVTRNGEVRWWVVKAIRLSAVQFLGFTSDVTDRKRAEEALRESEERLNFIFNAAQVGIILIDAATHQILQANPKALDLFGAAEQDVVGKVCHAVICPTEEGRCPVTDLKQDVDSSERVLLTRDGRQIPILKTVVRCRISGQDILIESFIDITDRKRAEEALRESEMKLSALFSSMTEMVVLHELVCDEEGRPVNYRITDCNDAFTRITGITRKNAIGRLATEVYGIPEPPYLREYSEVAQSGEPNQLETYFPPMEKYFAISIVSPEKNRFATITTDITERKKQAEELEGFFSVNLDLLCIADLDGNFLKINEAWSNILGYSTEYLKNVSFLEFVHPDDLQATLDAMTDLGRNKEVLNFINRYRCKDGSYRYIEWRSHPKGNLIYAAARDITDRKAAEEALQTANRKLQLLSGITRHEIQNKIMALEGYLDLTRSEIADPILSGYLAKAERAATAIREQIEFTKLYEKIGVHTPIWQQVSTLIRAIDDSVLPICHNCDDIRIYADPMFELVLYNLYDNTIRHAEGAKSVTIRCLKQGDSLVITWEDDGTGVPDDQKERIFEKGVGKNTGFGLFLVREILLLTGISILETGVFGEGVRFEIRVPGGKWQRNGEAI